MKKTVFTVILVLLVASMMSAKTKSLNERAEEIKSMAPRIAEDLKVEKKEMEILDAYVSSFFQHLEGGIFIPDPDLKLNEIDFDFMVECRNAATVFNRSLVKYGDDEKGTVQSFFKKYTGEDVEVESGTDVTNLLWSIFLIWGFSTILIVCMTQDTGKEKKKIIRYSTLSLAGVALVMFLLAVFLG